jgi:integrase
MKESTKQAYRKNAQGFFNRHFSGAIPSRDKILYVLHQISPQYTARSFSNLKAYLALYLEEKGHSDSAEQVRRYENRMAKIGNCNQPMRKIKTLPEDDIQKIIDAVRKSNKNIDNKQSVKKRKQLISAIWLAKELGARPCEMAYIKRTGITSFFVTTAKKDEFGQRGIDRYLSVSTKELADTLERCIGYLQGVKMSQVQGRFKYLLKKLFPRRKKLPTLYVFRHILGSNLKSSDLSFQERAYIMGHQSTRTMENYGYKNAGKGSVDIRPDVTLDMIESLVRDNHEERTCNRKNRLKRLEYKSGGNITPL